MASFSVAVAPVYNTYATSDKITVTYPSFYGQVYINKSGNELEIDEVRNNSFNLKSILDIVIQDLKNKKIYR